MSWHILCIFFQITAYLLHILSIFMQILHIPAPLHILSIYSAFFACWSLCKSILCIFGHNFGAYYWIFKAYLCIFAAYFCIYWAHIWILLLILAYFVHISGHAYLSIMIQMHINPCTGQLQFYLGSILASVYQPATALYQQFIALQHTHHAWLLAGQASLPPYCHWSGWCRGVQLLAHCPLACRSPFPPSAWIRDHQTTSRRLHIGIHIQKLSK